jgi:hypothetical protein
MEKSERIAHPVKNGLSGTCRFCGGACDSRATRCVKCRHAGYGVIKKSDEERLLSRVKINHSTGCWEYIGPILNSGYGQIKGRGAFTAHRLSWLIHKGAIPKGMCICHRCDNRICVNPDHLFLGDIRANSVDMWKKGRGHRNAAQPKQRGVRHWKAKLTVEQILEIRKRRDEPRKLLAKEFGTSARYISSIICRTKWKHLPVLEAKVGA